MKLTHEQFAIQTRRLILEESEWKTASQLGDLKKECKDHVVIRGRIMFSPAKDKVINTMEGRPDDWNQGSCGVSCAVCGVDLGWSCPKNPKGYCEYTHPNFCYCKHCGYPEERK